MAQSPARKESGAPGILYFDPNPTTARLATAGLRLAGYEVFSASAREEAVHLCTAHGPAGDGAIVALVLDTASDAPASADVLKAVAQVPGAGELPGILLVSRSNPTPIPGAEELPTLKRPFTTPALLKLLRASVETRPARSSRPGSGSLLVATVRKAMRQHFPDFAPDDAALTEFASHLLMESELPSPAAGVAFWGDLSGVKLDSVLEMIQTDGSTGVLTVEDEAQDRWGRIHLDRRRIRLAEIAGIDGDFKLGRFIVQSGFMTDEELETAAAARDPQGRPLGARLVDEGRLSAAELNQALLDQAREVTCELLTWTTGCAMYTPSPKLHPLAAAGARGGGELYIGAALLDGLRRIEEQAVMGPHMPEPDDVFLRLDDVVSNLGRHAFTSDELSVLELVNGRNTVKEIARKTRAGAFSVVRVLYRLTRAGVVRRRSDPVQV